MPKKKTVRAQVAIDATPSAGLGEAPRGGSKQALLCELMRRDTGASLQDLTSATSWQSHTVRAALTGLRKRGLEVAKEKVDGLTRYRLPTGA
jgi:hypothetical protein